MQKITPFLWFDGKAEEAVNFYVSTFKDAKVVSTTPPLDALGAPPPSARRLARSRRRFPLSLVPFAFFLLRFCGLCLVLPHR
jgi:hypothetical protein